MESPKRLQIRRVRTRNTLTPAKRDVQIAKLELSSPLPLLLLLLRPETLQRHKLKRKQLKAKTHRSVRDGYGERQEGGFAVEQTTTKTTKALLMSAPGIELVMERRVRQTIFLSKQVPNWLGKHRYQIINSLL